MILNEVYFSMDNLRNDNLNGQYIIYILRFKNYNCDSPNSPLECVFTLSINKTGYINNIT